jgi:hypothetical protein
LPRFEFEFGKLWWFYSTTILCGESRLLISLCAGDKCGMTSSDEDHDRSRRADAEDREWSSTGRVLDDRTIERSGNAVCGLHRA